MKGTESKLESEVKVSSGQENNPSLSQGPSALTGKDEASVRKSRLQRCMTCFGINWPGVVATFALLVSLLAYNESRSSGAATRLHNRLSVRPYMGLSFEANENGAGVIQITSCLGPGIVNTFDVTVDGKPVKTWEETLRAIQFSERDCKSSPKRVKGFCSTWGLASPARPHDPKPLHESRRS